MKLKRFCLMIVGILLLTNSLIAGHPIQSLQLQSLDDYRVELSPKFMNYLSGNTTVIFDGKTYKSMSEAIDLPFNFLYLGQTYTQIKVCTSGFITFNVAGYSTWDSDRENALGSIHPKNALAPFWDNDLSLINNSKIHYKTIGSKPNRVFIIEFLNINWGVFDVSLLNFQIHLYEANNDIEFHYGVMDNLSETDRFFVEGASIGIKDDQGKFINAIDGSRVTAQNNIKEPPDNNFRFTALPIPTNDIGVYGITSLPHTIRVGDSISISLKVKNYGTANQSDYSVSYRVNNESPITENFKTSLPPGSISTIVFETPWVPQSQGLNYLTAWSSLTNDENVKNDTLGTPKEVDVKNQEVLFIEDFESYPAGPLALVKDSPWVQLEDGEKGNVSYTWVHSGKKNLEISSSEYIEAHYVKLDLKHKPSQLNVELWYTPDGFYIYTDFAEIGLGCVTSKFNMDAIAGYWGSDHDVYFKADGMENSVLVFNELEYARGPASMGWGIPRHNYIRSEFDFTNNEVRFYIGTSSDAPLRSTINFDGTLNFNALYIAGGFNETYIDDIYVEAKGEYVKTYVDQEIASIPSSYYLSQNYPNPFNAKTSIEFGLPKADHVTIELINSLGQNIDVIVNSYLAAGKHIIEWNGEKYSSGVYYYRLRSGSFICTKKLLLLK